MLLNEAFNFYTVLCGNNELKQETAHSSMATRFSLLARETDF
jgi:hypothetical protein